MQIPVLVETLGDNRFRAEAPPPFSVVAEGKSSAEAVQNLRQQMATEFTNGKQVVMVDVPMPEENPWIKYAGYLKDDPLFDQWKAAMEEFRRECDAEEG